MISEDREHQNKQKQLVYVCLTTLNMSELKKSIPQYLNYIYLS